MNPRFHFSPGDDGGGQTVLDTPPSPAPTPAPPAPNPPPPPPAPTPTPPPPPADGKVRGADGKFTSPPPPAEPAPPAVKPAWPDDWRTLALGDENPAATPEEKDARSKMDALLKRYNSPADVAKALRAAQVKISDGTLKTALPKNATEEQLKTWRTENGIPDKPEKYDLGLPKGVELDERDKALTDAWVKDMHAANASPEMVKAGIAAWLKTRETQTAKVQQLNADAKRGVEDTLRTEWGGDYRSNVDGIQSLLNRAPPEVLDSFAGARMPDGVALLNKPEVIKWLAGHARELGYVGSTLDLPGGDLGKALDAEIAEIEKKISTDTPAYRKDTKMQARYQELLGARERRNAKK